MKRWWLVLVLTVILVLSISTVASAGTWENHKVWTGNGSSNNLEGYDLLWVLGGNGATHALLYVVRTDLSSQYATGVKQGNGAMHFVTQGVAGAKILAAQVWWQGEWVNAPLTISHTIGCQETTTTTTEEETTTTTEEETTTTTEEETTTTTGEETTTTQQETTTTLPLTTVTLIQTGYGPPPVDNTPYYVGGGLALLLMAGVTGVRLFKK